MVVVLAAFSLGFVVAAAITWGTSQLVRQRIGLASEPLTAGLSAVAARCELAGSRCALFGAARTHDEHAKDANATVVPANDRHTVPTGNLLGLSQQHSAVDDADRSARGIRPVVRGSGSEGGDSSAHRDD